jgi:hypothetical protein
MDIPSSHAQVLHDWAYHVFLPSRLPQRRESNAAYKQEIDLEILSSVIEAVGRYKLEAPSHDKKQWTRVERMLRHLRSDTEAPLEKRRLFENMQSMRTDGQYYTC